MNNKLVPFIESRYSTLSFQDYNNRILRFGKICPGALGTITYLKKFKNIDLILKKLIRLTDSLFFLELVSINNSFAMEHNIDFNQLKYELKQNSGSLCGISSILSKNINDIFKDIKNNYPNIYENIPDTNYANRHHILICTFGKSLVQKQMGAGIAFLGGVCTIIGLGMMYI